MQSSFAELTPYGLQCSGLETQELKSCLKKESSKIDDANLPNEIILTTNDDGKKSLLKLVEVYITKKNTILAEKIKIMIPTIENAVATALIIQFEDEPQLYYYVIDKNGKLEVVFDGINSADIFETFAEIFKSEQDVFYLKSNNISKTFLEWLGFLKE